MYFATAKEMYFLDKITKENGIDPLLMMELAGWHILPLIKSMGVSKKSNILVVCGNGNKGGDGLCAAKHLLNHGYRTTIIMMDQEITKEALHQKKLLEKMDANIVLYKKVKASKQDEIEKLINSSTLIIDALIGYGLKDAPKENYAEIIDLLNKAKKNIISYDVPTGIDATTGECFEPYIKAYATLTLAIPKKAFTKNKTRPKCGKIFVADIGIPHFLYDKIFPGSRPNFEQINTFFAPG